MLFYFTQVYQDLETKLGRRCVRVLLIGAVSVLVLAPAVWVGQHWIRGGFDPAPTARALGGGTKVVPVKLTEYNVEPATLVVEPGTRVVLAVRNEGDEDHDLAVEGGFATRLLEPGESERVELGQVIDREAICTVPGHEFFGMTMEIRTSTE